jgi:hypothetical protein
MLRGIPKTAGTGAASSADYRLLTAHMAESGLAWLNLWGVRSLHVL